MPSLIILLLLALAPYPYALSVPTAELQRGHSYAVTISAPEGAAVKLRLPLGIDAGVVEYAGGDTYHITLTVRDTAPLDRAPKRIALLIGGVAVASATVRIWTEAPVPRYRVGLPIILSAAAP